MPQDTSNSNSPVSNISRIRSAPSLPQNGNGQASKNDATNFVRMSPNTLTRSLSPLTRYNPETGIAEEIEDMGSLPQDDQSLNQQTGESQVQPANEEVQKRQAERHAKWKAEQADKQQAKEQAKQDKQVKQQLLAKDFLLKGDLVNAAKALNMSPTDLATYVDHARLGMPKEEKPLTPQRQREADEKKFRDDRLAFEQEQKVWREQMEMDKRSSIANNYIASHILPVLKDNSKYELLNHEDHNKVASLVYDHMNEHYRDTCTFDEEEKKWNTDGEELPVAEILQKMEDLLFQSHQNLLEESKKIKKFSNYFQTAETPEPEEESEVNLDDPWARKMAPTVKREITNPDQQVQTSSPDYSRDNRKNPSIRISQEKPMTFNKEEVVQPTPRSNGKKLSSDMPSSEWRKLSRGQRLSILRREERENQ